MADEKPKPDRSADTAGTSTTTSAASGAPSERGRSERRRDAAAAVRRGTSTVRTKIASAVWLVAVVCALFLAVGALLVALEMNQDNAIVAFVIDGAQALDLGTFKEFTGKNAEVKDALTNWGIAAVIYLVIGKALDRIIRP